MKTVLVVDDERDLVNLVDFHLSKEGFLVIGAKDGFEGFAMAKKHKPDLIVLDIMLPKIDGLETCRRLKADPEMAYIPVIMLTAKAQETDKIIGLEMGADDYVTKPFSPKELVSRIKAILRRFDAKGRKEVVKHGPLTIDIGGRTCELTGNRIELTNTEFNLLWYMANRPGRVVTRDELLTAARGEDIVVMDRTIDVHVVSLRKKLGKHKAMIETIRSVGYKFNPSAHNR